MVKTSTRIVGALALAGAMLSSGPVLAAKPGKGGGPGIPGDLDQTRTSVAVMIPVECAAPVFDPITNTTTTTTATLSVKIFQSVGRLINIGTGSGTPTCNGQTTDIAVTVKAVTGLTFQPGPATILITLTETATSSTPSVDPLNPNPVVVTSPPEITETGARIDLH